MESTVSNDEKAYMPDQSQGNVTVFFLPVTSYWTECVFNFETALQILPLRLQQPIKRLKSCKAQYVSLANQILQAYVIFKLLRLKDFEFSQVFKAIGIAASGKPYLRAESRYTFNMSNDHECQLTSMAVAEAESVGLDTIHVNVVSRDLFDSLKYQVLHPSEIQYVENSEHKFAQLWSLKEAYGKFVGDGIVGVDLRSRWFTVESQGITPYEEEKKLENVWCYSDVMKKDSNVHYAVVSDAKINSVNEVVLDLKELCLFLLRC